jgi:predicted O-methyltransferase YrrM
MENSARGKKVTFMNKVTVFMSFILFLGYGNTSLHSVPLSEDWDAYQNEVLKEHPNFPGWCPTEKAIQIMNLIHANSCEVCVELGVFGGSSFFPLVSALAFNKQGIAYAIDPWTNDACLEGYEEMNGKHHEYWGKVDLEKTMHKFVEGMHKNELDSVYFIMRMSSAQACPQFDDESIDFIHIDGNHSEQSAIFDVEHWLPKVKKGGIICFDDAWWTSTQPAIKILLEQCDLMKESSGKWQYIFLRKRMKP